MLTTDRIKKLLSGLYDDDKRHNFLRRYHTNFRSMLKECALDPIALDTVLNCMFEFDKCKLNHAARQFDSADVHRVVSKGVSALSFEQLRDVFSSPFMLLAIRLELQFLLRRDPASVLEEWKSESSPS